jgi:hypothetical protein
MTGKDINSCDIEIQQGEHNEQRKIGLGDKGVLHKVEIDGKSQKWSFQGAASDYYHNKEHMAYTAAMMHQDLIDLVEEKRDNSEMWLIDSGATAPVTASDEATKNVTSLKRHVKVGNGANCHVAGEGEIIFCVPRLVSL